MRHVAAFAAFAQAVAFDRLGEDHGRLAFAFDGRLVGRVHFFRIVAAAAHFLELFVGVVLHHLQQLGILAEEVLANVVAAGDDVLLILAVDDFHHPLLQQAGFVLVEQRIPIVAPDDFDDVPAGAAERAFELLNDLAVAAHRAVEPLQVAVDDEDQVVELLARGERDRAERFGLVAFAVAHERPDVLLRQVDDAAVGEVAIEPRLVDGHDRAEAHRDGGEFPELGHQPGMRIRRQPAARLQLAAEVDEVLFGEPAFEERAGVHAGRGVALEINLVAVEAAFAAAAEEVVEADFVQVGRRGEGGDVSADAGEVAIGADDHRHRVPADEALDAALQLALAGVARLLVVRDRVDVRRGGRERQLDAVANRGLLRARSAIAARARVLCAPARSRAIRAIRPSRPDRRRWESAKSVWQCRLEPYDASYCNYIHHRGTEDTEIEQEKAEGTEMITAFHTPLFISVASCSNFIVCVLCVLCGESSSIFSLVGTLRSRCRGKRRRRRTVFR